MRARDPLPALILLAALLSLGTPLIMLHGYDLATQFADDAFYYFQIAKNVAHGRGFTFDGVHPTNGFHPLWLAALVPVFGTITGLDAAVRAAGLLEVSFLGAAGALVYCTLRARIGREAALLAGLSVFMLPGTRHMLRLGLESALTVFMLSVVWSMWLARDTRTYRQWLELGACAGLLTLCRLEAWMAPLAIVFLERQRLLVEPSALAWFLAPPLLIGAAYFGWNASHFGLALPISGVMKHWEATRFSGYAFLGWRVSDAAPWVAMALVTLGVLYWLIHTRRPSWLAPVRDTGIELLVLSASGMFAADFVSLGYLEDWYKGPAVLCAAVALGTVLRHRATMSRVALALVLGGGLARVPYTVWSVRHHRWQAHLRGELADWLRVNTPPDARIGSWTGGVLGYYSGRHIIMLDALENSPTYFERSVVGGDFIGYLHDEHVDMLVTLSCKPWDPYARDVSASAAQLARGFESIAVLGQDESACHALRVLKRRR